MLRNGTAGSEREDRFLLTATNLRVATRGDGDSQQIIGYAAVFNQEADLFWFREKIAPGAFTRAITEKHDVRGLKNHDANLMLGRTKSGTLELAEDDHGLLVYIDPPDTQTGRDMLVEIGRGDIDQMSFGFTIVRQEWIEEEGQDALRIVKDVNLFDVSVVTFPAYEGTSAALRSAGQAYLRHLEGAGLVDDEQRQALQAVAGEVVACAQRGVGLAGATGVSLRARVAGILPGGGVGAQPAPGLEGGQPPTETPEPPAEGRQAAAGTDPETPEPNPQDVINSLVGY